MGLHRTCDTCGNPSSPGDERDWLHDYKTGLDECPRCQKRRRDRASAESMNRIRRDLGLPERPIVEPKREMPPAVRELLEKCRGYENYYDAYYGDNPPFPDQRPDPAVVAKALQDICRAVMSIGLRGQ